MANINNNFKVKNGLEVTEGITAANIELTNNIKLTANSNIDVGDLTDVLKVRGSTVYVGTDSYTSGGFYTIDGVQLAELGTYNNAVLRVYDNDTGLTNAWGPAIGFSVDGYATNAVEIQGSTTTFATHAIPSVDDTYDLGSADLKWRSLYVGTSTIYIGTASITVENGAIKVDGTASVKFKGAFTATAFNGLAGAIGDMAAVIDNEGKLAYYNTSSTSWKYIFDNTPVYVAPAPFSPTDIAGLVGWYDMSSVNGSNWDDKSGSSNTATLGSSVGSNSISGGGASITTALTGDNTADGTVTWPATMVTGDWTFFGVSRYNGSNKQRIFTAGSDWLVGHHADKSGVAYLDGAATDWNDHFGSNWVISSSQNTPKLYHGNGVNYAMSGGNSSAFSNLAINSKSDERSDWAAVEIIVYDTTLTSGQIDQVEAYLAAKYGITI